MTPIKKLIAVIFLALIVNLIGCATNNTLTAPECERTQSLSDKELLLLSQCTPDREFCQVFRQTLLTILNNQQSLINCLNLYDAQVLATQ